MHEIIALNYKPVANGAVYTRMDKNEEIIIAVSRTWRASIIYKEYLLIIIRMKTIFYL